MPTRPSAAPRAITECSVDDVTPRWLKETLSSAFPKSTCSILNPGVSKTNAMLDYLSDDDIDLDLDPDILKTTELTAPHALSISKIS